MTPSGNYPHIILPPIGVARPFSPKGGGGSSAGPSPVGDREAHARALLGQLEIIDRAAAMAASRDNLPNAENGVYVAIRNRPGEPLALKSLSRANGIELLAAVPRGDHLEATVFVPVNARARDCFRKIVEDYRTKNRSNKGIDTGKPANRNLVDGIESFRLAALRDLWMDDLQLFPRSGVTFRWETWLRADTLDRFCSEAERMGLRLGPAPLHFPETDVVLVYATPEQMASLAERTLCIAAVRRCSTTADFFDSLPPTEQVEFTEDLVSRIRAVPPGDSGTVICLLDTGVTIGHPLLSPHIRAEDCHSVEPAWGLTDTRGHGTEMAGVAAYGDLATVLDGTGPIDVPHRLESVKVIPPRGGTEYDQLGSATQQAVEYAELGGLDRRRIYCLATTTDEDTPHDGFPTAWSSIVDQLACGVGVPGGARRLFCVSGGNVSGNVISDRAITADDYPKVNDRAEIETPGQAWNALTVGAYTDKVVLTDRTLAGWIPLAAQGDLCPDSRTGCWEGGWPLKPELVLEGGNRAVHPADGIGYLVPDLKILTTDKGHPTPSFTTVGATSPATAEAARLAALVSAAHPALWAETIRALLVGSASWTPAMLAHLPPEPRSKGDYGLLLRRYGHGVPHLGRALRSASNCLSLIIQDTLQPYRWSEKSKGAVINEMKRYELPWPREALEAIPTAFVSMRVTLSYFVEPNPSETARGRKLRYASHGLRFKVILPDETIPAFEARINKAAIDETDEIPTRASDSQSWMLGAQQRNVGSIHSDTWRGSASDLARLGVIAVHPVGGWWKERPHLDRWSSSARFALVVTIDAGDNDIDIYTPVATTITNLVTT